MEYADVRHAITVVGGLIGVAGLADATDLTTQRIHELSRMEGFPPRVPVEGYDVKLWLRDEAFAWLRATGRL